MTFCFFLNKKYTMLFYNNYIYCIRGFLWRNDNTMDKYVAYFLIQTETCIWCHLENQFRVNTRFSLRKLFKELDYVYIAIIRICLKGVVISNYFQI